MSGVRLNELECRMGFIGPSRKISSMKIGMIKVSSMGPLRAR